MPASGADGNCGHHKLLPKTCEPADLRSCRNQSLPLDQVFAAGKTLGLDHRDQIERLPSKILFEAWDVSGVDIDVVASWPPSIS